MQVYNTSHKQDSHKKTQNYKDPGKGKAVKQNNSNASTAASSPENTPKREPNVRSTGGTSEKRKPGHGKAAQEAARGKAIQAAALKAAGASPKMKFDYEYASCAKTCRRGYEHKIKPHERQSIASDPQSKDVCCFGGEYTWGKTTGYTVRGDELDIGHYHIVDPVQCTGSYTPFKVEKNLNLAFPHRAEVLHYDPANVSEPPWRRHLATNCQNRGAKGSRFRNRSSVISDGSGAGSPKARPKSVAARMNRMTSSNGGIPPVKLVADSSARNSGVLGNQVSAVANQTSTVSGPASKIGNVPVVENVLPADAPKKGKPEVCPNSKKFAQSPVAAKQRMTTVADQRKMEEQAAAMAAKHIATPGESAKQPYAATAAHIAGKKGNSKHHLSPNSAPMAGLPNSAVSLNGHKSAAAAASAQAGNHHASRTHRRICTEDPSHGNPNKYAGYRAYVGGDSGNRYPSVMKDANKGGRYLVTAGHAFKIPMGHERFGHE